MVMGTLAFGQLGCCIAYVIFVETTFSKVKDLLSTFLCPLSSISNLTTCLGSSTTASPGGDML